MKRLPSGPRPSGIGKPSTVGRRSSHSTVPAAPPVIKANVRRPPRSRVPKRSVPMTKTPPPPKRQIARVIDEAESTLLDVIDNLLGKGVMLNADLILALANVDLVYIRLSALLCAADRVLPRGAGMRARRG